MEDNVPVSQRDKIFADELTEPLTVINNKAIRKGQLPDIWIMTNIMLIPKEYPTNDFDQKKN